MAVQILIDQVGINNMDNQLSKSERIDLIILCFIRLKGFLFRLLETYQFQNLFGNSPSIPPVVLKTADVSINPYHQQIQMAKVFAKHEQPMFFSCCLLSLRLPVSLLMEFKTWTINTRNESEGFSFSV